MNQMAALSWYWSEQQQSRGVIPMRSIQNRKLATVVIKMQLHETLQFP
jgi:hypothetical protein